MQAVEENSKPSESATHPIPDPLHIWTGLADANAANAWVEHHLAASRACIAELLAVTGPRTVDNTLVPYDRACWHLRMAGSQSGVMFMVHPARRRPRRRSATLPGHRRRVRSPQPQSRRLPGPRRPQRICHGRAHLYRPRNTLLPRSRSPRLPSLRRRQRRAHPRSHPHSRRHHDAAKHDLQPRCPGRRPQNPSR